MPPLPDTSFAFAKKQDEIDPLSHFRNQFHFPRYKEDNAIYLCGNSLGLQHNSVESGIKQELKDWQDLGVGGYLNAKNPWLYYQRNFQKPLSKLMGCKKEELTVMNGLTVNLHLMMLSFYRPTRHRFKILMEAGAFPSDQYAAETQVKFHGFDPEEAILEIGPAEGEKLIREEVILDMIDRHRDSLALVLIGGINYYTGQYFDLGVISRAAHQAGAIAGFDLAHVVGNIPLNLHDWHVDFAVWCSYKYLNGGPGAAGGAFIHEKYATDTNYPRMAGWWGNEEKTRFRMEKGFHPKPDTSGWNISTAQVFNMVALKEALTCFDQAGIEAIRVKSMKLTGYLESLLGQLSQIDFEIITPSDPERRGAQLSLLFGKNAREIHQKMIDSGIIVDYREPNVIRVAPAPLYNSFEDVYKFYQILNNFK